MTTTLRTRLRRRALPLAVALGGLATVACDDSLFQVIENVEFAPSLGIVLDSMQRLESGVYVRDSIIGTGNTVFSDSQVRVGFVGYVSDGSSFGDGEFGFGMSTNAVIPGFELGIIGMNQGGLRRLVIPPELGYGDEEQTGIPAGSVLIFDVEVIEVANDEDPG